jgi:hypothetical protein
MQATTTIAVVRVQWDMYVYPEDSICDSALSRLLMGMLL